MSEAPGPQISRHEELFLRGRKFLDRGMIDEAIDQLEQLATDPEWSGRVYELLNAYAQTASISRTLLSPRLRQLLRLLTPIGAIGDVPLPNFKIDPPDLNPAPSTRRGSPQRRSGRPDRSGKSRDVPVARSEPRPIEAPAPPIERTPHMRVDVQGEIRSGTTFSVAVLLDKLPSTEGELADPVRAAPGSRVEMTLGASGHFSVEGTATATFVLRDVDRIDVGTFAVRVVAQVNEIEGIPFLAAIFYVDGRPCGSVTRRIEIAGNETGTPKGQPATDAALSATLPSIAIGPNGLERADITVTVVAADANDGRSFICTVETGHPSVAGERKTAPWNLANTTRDLVGGFMKGFVANPAGSKQLIAELKGAGNVLFDSSPRIFRDTFWSLVDAGLSIRTIAIVTAEPFIPWELMIPNRWKDDLYEERPALGVEFQIGRWTSDQVISPARRIILQDSFVIAPVYSGSQRLQNSDVEAAMVLRSYRGERIAPADFGTIETRLGSEARTLVHFICHGNDDGGGIQSLVLEGGAQLPAHALLGMTGLAKLFRSKRPLVFLNACKVGQPLPSLVGLGGFVVSFIKLGATAVIAPLWSVEDDVAHDVATEFYQQLSFDPKISLAKIFSTIRAKAYEDGSGRDTYAAYCFYGDPFASLG